MADAHIPSSPTIRQVSAFVGATRAGGLPAARGNPCRIVLSDARPGETPGPAGVTQCLTWPLGQRRAGVSCRGADGGAIRCCGHGLLSCADYWCARWGTDGVLESGGAELPVRARHGHGWVGFPFLTCERCATPAWLPALLGREPLNCARAGGEQGYLVVELHADSDLTRLAPPDASLGRLTARAIIVACGVSAANALCGETVHFRYFAPQYGVVEDSATGSAMRVLASHWRERAEELVALQRSAAGGYLKSSIDGNSIWVGGYVAPDSSERLAHAG